MLFDGDGGTLTDVFAGRQMFSGVSDITTIGIERFVSFGSEDGGHSESLFGLVGVADNSGQDWLAKSLKIVVGMVDVTTVNVQLSGFAETESAFVGGGIAFFGDLLGVVSISFLGEFNGGLLQQLGCSDSIDESLEFFRIVSAAFERSDDGRRNDASEITGGNDISAEIFRDDSAFLGKGGNGELLVGSDDFTIRSEVDFTGNAIDTHGVFEGLSVGESFFLRSVSLKGTSTSLSPPFFTTWYTSSFL